jgi:hypothetical protein
MKNNLITAVFTMVGFLMAQNFPILTGFLVYLAFAFLIDNYVTKVALSYYESESEELAFRFFFGLLWPVSFFIVTVIEYEKLKKFYNLPSIRNPFYWPEK